MKETKTAEVVETNEAITILDQSGLEQSKAQYILNQFQDYFKSAAELELKAKSIVVTDATQLTEMKQAREYRIALKNKRCEVENTRVKLKEQSIREGKAIDGVANVLKALIVPLEEHLEKQERFAEIAEAKRKSELAQTRKEQLAQFECDSSFYDLGNMPNEQYVDLVAGAELTYNQKIEAKKREEKERIDREAADAKRRQDIEDENKRLRKEADDRSKKEAAEKAEKEAKDAEIMKIRKQYLLNLGFKDDPQAQLLDNGIASISYAIIVRLFDNEFNQYLADMKKRIQDHNEKIEADRKLKDIEDKAAEQKKEKDKADRKAKRAPDKSKLEVLAAELNLINWPECNEDDYQEVVDYAKTGISEIVDYLKTSAKALDQTTDKI